MWAPNARDVCVIGEWNGWKPGADKLCARWDHSGIWEALEVAAFDQSIDAEQRFYALDGLVFAEMKSGRT